MPEELQQASQPQAHASQQGDSEIPLPNTSAPAVDDIAFVVRQISGVGSNGDDDESQEARIERLGRERPEKFRTIWAEIGFVFSIVMSQVLTVRLCVLISLNDTYSTTPRGRSWRRKCAIIFLVQG